MFKKARQASFTDMLVLEKALLPRGAGVEETIQVCWFAFSRLNWQGGLSCFQLSPLRLILLLPVPAPLMCPSGKVRRIQCPVSMVGR